MSDEYQAVKEKFKEGDYVIGTNKHVGCSNVFNHDTDQPQPFSYLSETDPAEFRLATVSEIKAAYPLVSIEEIRATYPELAE